MPAVDSTTTGVLPLTVVALLLILAGFLGWRRRDLHA
jgi:putative exporter of polyketide antibiotics